MVKCSVCGKKFSFWNSYEKDENTYCEDCYYPARYGKTLELFKRDKEKAKRADTKARKEVYYSLFAFKSSLLALKLYAFVLAIIGVVYFDFISQYLFGPVIDVEKAAKANLWMCIGLFGLFYTLLKKWKRKNEDYRALEKGYHYACDKCDKKFKTIEEVKKHEKTCKS